MHIATSFHKGNCFVEFGQETMDKGSRVITIYCDDGVVDIYSSLDRARELATMLLDSVNEFERKYIKR